MKLSFLKKKITHSYITIHRTKKDTCGIVSYIYMIFFPPLTSVIYGDDNIYHPNHNLHFSCSLKYYVLFY